MADTSAPSLSADLRVMAYAYKGANLARDDYEIPPVGAPVTIIDELEYFFDKSFDEKTGTNDHNALFRECLANDGNPTFIRIYYQRYADVPPSTPLFEETDGDSDDELEEREPTLIGTEPNEEGWAQLNIRLGDLKISEAFGDRTFNDVVFEMEDIDILQTIADTPGMQGDDYERLQAFIDRAAREGLAFTIRFGTRIRAPQNAIVLSHRDEIGDECGALNVWIEDADRYRQDPQGAEGELQDAELIPYDCTDLIMGKILPRDFIETYLPAAPMNPARANGEPLVPWQAIVDPFDDDDDAEAEGAENWLSVLYAARHYGDEGWEFIAQAVLDEMGVAPKFPDRLIENFHRRLDSGAQITARPSKGPHLRDDGDAPAGVAPPQ